MNSLVNLLEGFEKLAYKLLMWIILIPKTIFKIIVDPGFARGYISRELNGSKDSVFDEYISPMLLYLGVMLLPAVALYLIPAFGISLSSSYDEGSGLYHETLYQDDAETIPGGHLIEFALDSELIASTSSHYHRVEWTVYECGTLDVNGYCTYDKFSFKEVHDERSGVTTQVSESATPEPVEDYIPIWFPDDNSMSDNFLQYFFDPGSYMVSAMMESVNIYDEPAETYNASAFVFISDDLVDYQVYSSNPSLNKENNNDFEDQLRSNDTVLLGLVFLLPPLFMALIANWIGGSGRMISENSLREHFYTQCYYFAPLGLALWASVYSTEFHTVDLSVNETTLIYPLILAFLWFLGAEVSLFAELSASKSKWKAFLILMGSLLGICLIAVFGAAIASDYDLLRRSAIWAFPVLAFGLVVFKIISSLWKRWRARKKEADIF